MGAREVRGNHSGAWHDSWGVSVENKPAVGTELGESEPPVRKSGVWRLLRPVVLRVHFYAGVLIAPFLLVAAVTGMLYIFTPQMEQMTHSHELTVPAGQTRQPLASQVAAAGSVHPGEPSMVWPATSPTDTTRVIYDPPDSPESFFHTVFVNPYNNEIRGVLETYGSGQALPVRTWFDQLHRNLHLGDPGRIYSELAASWLWVVALGGVLLWIGRRRNSRRVKGILLPQRGARGRQRVRSWHGVLGVWLAVGFMFLSATGLTWSLFAGENVTAIKAAFDSETPEVSTSAEAGGQTGDVGVDRVLHIARQNGLSGQVEIVLPPEQGDAYSVMQTTRHWPVQQDQIAVQAGTGEVSDIVRFEDYPLLAKLSRWGIDLHMGLLFGWVNQLVLALLAGSIVVMLVLGYRMWWLRRPTQASTFAFGPPPMRTVWRRVPGKILAPIILAVVLVGYLFPLLGASLVVFLALDTLLARRKSAQRIEVSS